MGVSEELPSVRSKVLKYTKVFSLASMPTFTVPSVVAVNVLKAGAASLLVLTLFPLPK